MNSQKQYNKSKLESSCYDRDFNAQISKYPQLIPYIIEDNSSNSEQNHEIMLKTLDFYSTEVLQSPPIFVDSSVDMIFFYSSDNLKIHTVIFLSHKIWKKQIKKYREKVSLFSTLIYFLHSYVGNLVENKIVIKYQSLVDYFQKESALIQYLRCFIHKIKLESHLSQNFNPNNKKLYYMFIQDVLQSKDNYIHCLQHVFEAAISSKKFIFFNEINSFIQNHQNIKPDAINTILFDISKKVANYYGINNTREIHILLISFIRYIYDQIYPATCQSYFKKESKHIIQNVSNLAFKKLCVNIRLFPHSIRPSKPFCSILRNDPYYQKAVWCLEDIQFVTNPLDMLFCVQRSLKSIEEAASFYSHKKDSKPFNFHEIVSIFLAVTISSEIPEIIEIHQFINNHFFNDILFPEICYVRAAFESCILHLYELNKEIPIKKII